MGGNNESDSQEEGLDDAGCQLGVRGVERRIPRSQQLQLAERLLQEVEAVVLRDRILGQVPFAGVDADLALVRADVQDRTPVSVVLVPGDLGQLVADVDLMAQDAVDGLFPVEPRELGAPQRRPDHCQHQFWFLLDDVDRRREAGLRQHEEVARRSQAVPAHADGNVPVRRGAADRVELALLEEGEAIALRVRWLSPAIDPGHVVWGDAEVPQHDSRVDARTALAVRSQSLALELRRVFDVWLRDEDVRRTVRDRNDIDVGVFWSPLFAHRAEHRGTAWRREHDLALFAPPVARVLSIWDSKHRF